MEAAYLDFVNSYIPSQSLARLAPRATHAPHAPHALEAVIVEPRCHVALEGVLYNFAYFLPHASFTIYHSDENSSFVSDIISRAGTPPNAIKLVNFREGNMGRDDYNQLLKSPRFWNDRTAERTLIFQTDTGLLKNSVAQYWDYAFVGAPWTWHELGDPFFRIGNGGLSLRDTAFSQQLTHTVSQLPEDVHFAYAALYASRLPSVKTAASFSMEWMDHPDPMGFHQAYRLTVHSQSRRDSLLKHYDAHAVSHTHSPILIIDAWIENARDGRTYAVANLKERIQVACGPSGLTLPKKTRMWPSNVDSGAINAQPKKLVIQWKRPLQEIMQTMCPLDPKLRIPIDLSI